MEARTNVVDAIYNTGGEEAAWRESKAFLSDADRAPKRERPPTNSLIYPATYTWDLSRALASLLENAATNGVAGTAKVIAGLSLPMIMRKCTTRRRRRASSP